MMLLPSQTASAQSLSAPVKIRQWRPYQNAAGTVLGYLDPQLPSGMIICGCKLMRGQNGKRWIALPAIKQFDQNGEPLLDANGKQIWSPVVEFTDRNARERFTGLVLDALRRQYPDALGELEPKDASPPRRSRSVSRPRGGLYAPPQKPRGATQRPDDDISDLWREPAA